ncbi:MAG: hypothetical protein ABIT71_13005 [Vicinamibacteraceae bacterium]
MAVLVAALVGAAPAAAQVMGYGIAGPAGYTGFFGGAFQSVHVAGGGEILAGGRVGGGGEFGLLANSDGGLFVTSANVVFHFMPSQPTPIRSRLSPYVSSGYSRLSGGEGGFHAWNAAFGTDVWLKPHVGLRLEFRDHVRPDSRGGVHYWAFRAGVAFR